MAMYTFRESMIHDHSLGGSVPLAARFWASVKARIRRFTACRLLHFSIAAKCSSLKPEPEGPGRVMLAKRTRAMEFNIPSGVDHIRVEIAVFRSSKDTRFTSPLSLKRRLGVVRRSWKQEVRIHQLLSWRQLSHLAS